MTLNEITVEIRQRQEAQEPVGDLLAQADAALVRLGVTAEEENNEEVSAVDDVDCTEVGGSKQPEIFHVRGKTEPESTPAPSRGHGEQMTFLE